MGLTAALVVATQPAIADEHGLGEPCGARADCREGLRCLRNACVDDDTFAAARAMESAQDGASFRGYIGASLGAMLPVVSSSTAGEGAQPAFHAGLLNERYHLQLQLEVAAAYVANLPTATGLFDAVGTIGYQAPISDMVGWIVRFGVGGGVLSAAGLGLPERGCPACASTNEGFIEFRFDIVGVAIRTSEHVQLEFGAPSFRVLYFPTATSGSTTGSTLFTWVSSLSVNYQF
jgi:hypothetical protein